MYNYKAAAIFAATTLAMNTALFIPAHARVKAENIAMATVHAANRAAALNKTAAKTFPKMSKVASTKDYYAWLEAKNVPDGDTSFKSFMDKDAVTDRTSDQWDLIHNYTYIDNYGFLHSENYGEYIVAVAPYYGAVGDKLTVVLDGQNGDVYVECVIGDIKENPIDGMYHPVGDEDNRKNVVEFVVETTELEPMTKKMGDCSYSSNHLEGNVKAIYSWPEQLVE